MAKRKTHKEDRKGWSLFHRLLADYIELTRFPELPERPKQGKNYEYWPDDALCANGNPYHGCIRLGSANKLMIGFSGGGVSVDETKVSDPNMPIPATEFVLHKGKKVHLKIVVK